MRFTPYDASLIHRREWSDYLKIGAVVLLISFFLFIVCDMVYGAATGKFQVRYAKVHDKEYRQWTTTDEDGHKTNHQEWKLKVCVAGDRFTDLSVSHSQYDSIKVGDNAKVREGYGGITGWSYGFSFSGRVEESAIPKEGN